MKFSEEHTYKVKLHHRELGELGESTLTFGGERPVVAAMGLLSPGSGLGTGRSLDFVSAKTEAGHAFTLCRCTVHGFAIYATYLVCGDITEDRFHRIDIRYSDISEWFLNRQRIQGTVGEQLNWTTLAEHFSVEVTDGAQPFALSSKYVGSRDQIGEDYVLHEYVEFSFESSSGEFTLEDVRDKAIELGSLLSLLIAYPISVISVEVLTGKDRLYSAYFGTFKQQDRDHTRNFSYQCFVQKHALDGRWQLIFRNYYQSSELKELWGRLAGMQRYDGFWEFRLLGYVSLLDKYVTWRASTLPNVISPPEPTKLNELEAELNQLFPKLDTAATLAIVEIAKGIFAHRDSTFARKYAHSIDKTDCDIRRIIDITDEDFRLIKKVRDRIAHGEHSGLGEDEFMRINAVVGKISLLLTYWTFLDLGLSKDDFLNGLNATHSRLRLGAPLNEKHLARVSKKAAFFSVSAEKFQFLSSRKDLQVFACFIEGPPSEIEISPHYTEIWRSWNMNPIRLAGMISWEKLFDVEDGVVRHEGTVYIESGSNSLQLSAVCIFDKSKLPS